MKLEFVVNIAKFNTILVILPREPRIPSHRSACRSKWHRFPETNPVSTFDRRRHTDEISTVIGVSVQKYYYMYGLCSTHNSTFFCKIDLKRNDGQQLMACETTELPRRRAGTGIIYALWKHVLSVCGGGARNKKQTCTGTAGNNAPAIGTESIKNIVIFVKENRIDEDYGVVPLRFASDRPVMHFPMYWFLFMLLRLSVVIAIQISMIHGNLFERDGKQFSSGKFSRCCSHAVLSCLSVSTLKFHHVDNDFVNEVSATKALLTRALCVCIL